jgi:hypothetical protein
MVLQGYLPKYASFQQILEAINIATKDNVFIFDHNLIELDFKRKSNRKVKNQLKPKFQMVLI